MSDASPSPRPELPARRPASRSDTIVAQATPPGRSGIAIVRVSGPDAERIGRRTVTPWPRDARTLTHAVIHEPDRQDAVIDRGLAVLFPGPRSYTGETVLEVHLHGGTYLVAATTAAFVAAGARPAAPGEFTERAVLNGKLDLVRAEAIGALINARTRAAHRAAVSTLSGTLTRQYETLRERAIALEAMLAYDVDFPEEDDGPVSRGEIEDAAVALEAALTLLVATAPMATIAESGALVVLAGPPNAGKSSLLNALTGTSRVIVSDEPGTTRDAVEVTLDGDPWPIRLVDTAGLRANAAGVERLGMEVSERYLARADIVLLCSEHPDEFVALRRRLADLSMGLIIEVQTKADRITRPDAVTRLAVSAVTGAGLATLRSAIMDGITRRAGPVPADAPLVVSQRQQEILKHARAEMAEFRRCWHDPTIPATVAATHVHEAVTSLGELIGTVSSDEVLARVFSTFCVGK